jgi:hypothetical protein
VLHENNLEEMKWSLDARDVCRLRHPQNKEELAAHFRAGGSWPPFDKCKACGADAKRNCYWDNSDGWCCTACGGSDADE